MIITVKDSAPFQILTSAMVIGPSQTGYQLEVAADGRNFSPLFSVGPNVTRQATNLSSGAYYRLNGNVGDVVVNWNRSCVTEGGADSTELTPIDYFPLAADPGTVVAYSGSASATGVYQYNGTEWVPVGVDDLSAYWTSAETKDYVDSADTALQEQIDTMDEVVSEALVDLNERIGEISGSSVDLSSYWTSAETQSAITAVENHLFDVEEVTASALTELHNAVLELSGSSVDLSGYYTSGETDAAISAAVAPYYTSAQTDTKIAQVVADYTPTSGFSTINGSAITNGGDIVIQGGGGDLSQYWTSAQTKTYVDSADTALQDRIDTMDEVISDALNDLNGELASKVSSSSVSIIWKGTQAEYNAATQSGATADPATLYIIV